MLLATVTLDSVLPFRLRDRGIPFVYFNRVSPAVDADSTTANPQPGLEEAAEEIVRFGHRRIAAIFGPRNTSTAEQREIALREALDRRGLSIPTQSSFSGHLTSPLAMRVRDSCCSRIRGRRCSSAATTSWP